MIRCESINVKISGKTILQDVALKFPENSIAVIIGKNGSGKTTLLRAIAGAVKYSGKISIEDKDIKNIKISELSKIVSIMPQVLPLPHVKVNDIVSFGRNPYTGFSGVLGEQDKDVVNNCIKRADIVDISEKYTDEISGGERRKVFFAMLLAQDTSVMLLDEPTANLDASYSRKMMRMITDCKENGKTVVLVLHDINQALEVADFIAAVDNGRCVFLGTVKEACDKKIPEKILSVRPVRCIDDNGTETIIYR